MLIEGSVTDRAWIPVSEVGDERGYEVIVLQHFKFGFGLHLRSTGFAVPAAASRTNSLSHPQVPAWPLPPRRRHDGRVEITLDTVPFACESVACSARLGFCLACGFDRRLGLGVIDLVLLECAGALD